ncbi:MAG: YceI family protein [Gracilimonas sp.]|jgi:polyisoprenoid-binding protein YceI|nr:YceI family protein [Gracilimonas sp.]
MKKLALYAVFATLFTFGSAFTITHNDTLNDSLSTSWVLDKSHSTVQFQIKHFFTPVTGRFDDYQTDIKFDPEDLANSSIDVTIPISSINTQNEKRDNHLKSEDFFNTNKWPNLKFKSDEIRKTGESTFVAIGALTIRDVTKKIELPFTLLGVMDHPMMEGTKVAGITANTTINRTDFGVGVGDWAATMVVGDEVNIDLNLELNSK